MKSLAIKVQTYHGQVILSGFVDNAAQSKRAVEIASGVRGVLSVKNSLVIKS
jgi:hyperosmotically inducible protein